MAEKSCEDCYEEDLMKCAGCKRKPESAAGEITRPQSRKPLQIQAFSAGEEEQTMPDIKEKLVELLAESEILCNDCGPHGNSYCIEAIADHLIANGVTIQKWISVEERLPEPGERVLTTDGAFVGEMYINKRGQWQRYNVNNQSLMMALDILWWMPLPEPPNC